ncbi:hypothetical protein JXA88_17325 [Candidatus Fermentibacteria bacterium]|nr:hypothetical protein [Candidatus Fermentibacteria bacterium]
MPERVIDLLARLNVAYKKLRLYPPEHTMCATAIDSAMAELHSVIADESAITIGLTGTTAVHKGVPLVDLGAKAQVLLDALAAIKAQWVRFDRALTRDELIRFLIFLADHNDLVHRETTPSRWQGEGIRLGFAEGLDSPSDLYTGAGEALQAIALSFRAGGSSLPLLELGDFVQRIGKEVAEGSPPLGVLELAMTQREYIIRRSLLTSTLGMGIGRRLGLPSRLLPELGLAGMLADLALFRVDEPILNSRHGGTQMIPRWAEHPSEAARILSAAGAPSLVIVVAAEHHWGLKYASPARHPASSLVGLADTLVGYFLGGYGSASHRLDLALIEVASEHTHYPAELVRAVLQMSGLFVKGARVRLSNRAKGEIVTPNPVDPLRPEVLIDGEGDGMRLIDLNSQGERLALAAVLGD